MTTKTVTGAHRLRLAAGSTVTVAAAIGVWWLITIRADSLFFPSPSKILRSFINNWLSDAFVSDALPSLGRLAAGFILAMIVGMVLGLGLGMIPGITSWVGVELEFLRALPPILIFPPLLLALGPGVMMEISVIAVASVWPILLAAIHEARSVRQERLDMAAIYGLKGWAVVRWIIIPSALPGIWGGVRAAMPIAFVVMIAAEYYASSSGIGNFVQVTAGTFRIVDTWSAVLLMGVIGIVVNMILVKIGKIIDQQYGEYSQATSGGRK